MRLPPTATTPETTPTTWTVNIDGADRTIATTQTIVEYLAANVGKVFAVDWNLDADDAMVGPDGAYGFVKNVYLVNEKFDDNLFNLNYLTGNNVTFGNNVIDTDEGSYRITADTVFVGGTAVNGSVYADNGIWVDYSSDGFQLVADVIYIGAKLDESVALTVDAKDGTVSYNGTTITVTSKEDATSDELTYIANDANSVIVYNGTDTKLHTVTVNVNSDANKRTVTVWDEAGTHSAPYTIKLVWAKSNSAIGRRAISELDGEVWEKATGYSTLAEAIAKATEANLPNKEAPYTLNLDADCWSDVVTFTNAAAIDEDEFAANEDISAFTTSETLSGINVGSYVVIKMVNGDSTADPSTWDVAYYAYQIVE